MKKSKSNWLKVPTKKQLYLFTIAWFLSIILLVLSMTNLFSESIFQGKYLLIYFLIIWSTLTVYKLHSNYWKLAGQ